MTTIEDLLNDEERRRVVLDTLKQLEEVETKYGRAFASQHECYGVLAEEMKEYFDEVCMKREDRSLSRIRAELIDIAVAALRGATAVSEAKARVEPYFTKYGLHLSLGDVDDILFWLETTGDHDAAPPCIHFMNVEVGDGESTWISKGFPLVMVQLTPEVMVELQNFSDAND